MPRQKSDSEVILQIFKTLFGVELVMDHAQPGETWDPDVYKLAVLDVSGERERTLGFIYCDFFVRQDKPAQVTITLNRVTTRSNCVG